MVDTGPPYPLVPVPNSNAIGEFQIGISPLGDIPPFDWWNTVLSQYANSPRMMAIIANIYSYLDQTKNFDAFFDLVMNLDTAQGYGLDVWGRIVGVNRVLEVQSVTWFGFEEALPGDEGFNYASVIVINPSFSFAEAAPTAWTFGEGVFGLNESALQPQYNGGAPFYSGETLTNNYALFDESYRLLIFAKAAANITNGSIPAINAILMNLFPHRGNAYVTEGYSGGLYFGFMESQNALPFNQGVFYANESVPYMTMTYTFKFQLTPVEIAIVEQSGVLPKPTGVYATTVIDP